MRKKLSLLLCLGLLSGCGAQSTNTSAPSTSQTTVTTSYTLQPQVYTPSLNLTGTLEALQSTSVSAKSAGRVSSLLVEVGTSVKSGDLLAQLSADETTVSHQTAANDSAQSRSYYEAQKALLDNQVAAAEQALKTVQTSLAAAQTTQQDTSLTTQEQITLAEKQVAQAQTVVDNAAQAAAQRLTSLQEGGSSVLRGALSAGAAANTFAENLLETREDTAESYADLFGSSLGALEPSTKQDARTLLFNTLKEIEDFSDFYDANINNQSPSSATLTTGMHQAQTMLENTQEMLKKVYLLLDKSITSSTLTSTTLASLKSQTLTLTSNVESAIFSATAIGKSGVKGWLTTQTEITTQNTTEAAAAQAQLDSANQALVQAKASVSQALNGTQSQINVLTEQVAQAETALESAKAQRTAVLEQLGRDLNASSGNVLLTEVGLANTKVTAPYDGIVTAKLVEIGQVIAAGQPVYQISNNNAFKVVAYLPDINIGDISLNMPATITLDSTGEEISAHITKIDPAVNPTTRKLGIELQLNTLPSSAHLGEFAHINIPLASETTYFIPATFIQYGFDGPYLILEDNSTIPVSLGTKQDDLLEIISSELQPDLVITR